MSLEVAVGNMSLPSKWRQQKRLGGASAVALTGFFVIVGVVTLAATSIVISLRTYATATASASLTPVYHHLFVDRHDAGATDPLTQPHTSLRKYPILLPTVQWDTSVVDNNRVDSLLRQSGRSLADNPRTDKKFVLYRAIGNDLPPRHARGQTYDNVKFILDHEPNLDDLDVRWYVNRILNQSEYYRIVSLLVAHNATFVAVPFNLSSYAEIDYRLHDFKRPDILRSHIFRHYSYANFNERRLILDAILLENNHFIIHNNQARNDMIDLGIQAGAQYILPWDGNCFLTSHAWNEVRTAIYNAEMDSGNQSAKYFSVPMERVTNNTHLLEGHYRPLSANEEPQLVFRHDAVERFNESLTYGCRPKIDLLMRLRVQGKWMNFTNAKMICLALEESVMPSDDIPANDDPVANAGWVARLFSGKARLERRGAIVRRGLTRTEGIEAIAGRAALKTAHRLHGFMNNVTTFLYDYKTLADNLRKYQRNDDPALSRLVAKLMRVAEDEITLNSLSTSTTSSSSDEHVVRADGMTHNAALDDDVDNNSSLTHIHIVPQNASRFHAARFAIIHTLAGLFSGELRYVLRGRAYVSQLFTDKQTRASEHGKDIGDGTGLSALLCAALDAAKLQLSIGVMSEAELQEIQHWARDRAKFFESTTSGRNAYYSDDIYGTLVEVDAACAAAINKDGRRLMRATAWARPRLWVQYSPGGNGSRDGVSGVAAWAILAQIGTHVGVDIWTFGIRDEHGGAPVLRDAIASILPSHLNGERQSAVRKIALVRRSDDDEKRRHLDSIVAEYVWWVARHHFDQLEGGFWGNLSLNGEDLNVARHVYDAPVGLYENDEVFYDDRLFVPPFWNLAFKP